MDTLLQDLRFALRTLRRRPVFAAIAAATLSLGIGSATTVFSVVKTVLVESVPFEGKARLVNVWQIARGARGAPGLVGQTWDRLPISFGQYRDWQVANTLFDCVAVHNAVQATLTTRDGAERVWIGFGSASLLSVLGVQPVLGRWFRPEEEGRKPGEGASPVAVVSYETWQVRLGGNPKVLGTTVTLDGRAHAVVGVLPAGFRLRYLGMHWLGADRDGRRDVWAPIGTPGLGNGNNLEAVARLARGVPDDRVIAEATRIFEASRPGALVRLAERASDETRGLTSPLLLLFAATGLLLLIGCANVAALLLGELVARRRELSTRMALGAGASRIARQLLTETLVIGALGGVIGAGLAFAGTRLMVALGPPLPRVEAVRVDPGVLAFAVVLAMVAAAVSGTLPALTSARRGAAVLDPSRGASRARGRLERAVVASEVAMTVVLLVVGGLLGRSLTRLLAVDPGFEPAGLATIRIALPDDRLRTAEAAAATYEEILARIRALPGVTAASATTRLPFPGETNTSTASFVDRNGAGRQFGAQQERVLPGYHETLRIPLRLGRTFTAADDRAGEPVAMVSENIARRFWPGRPAVGERITWNGRDVTIVGVAGDVRRNSLGAASDPVVWVPLLQSRDRDLRLVARTAGDPASLLPAMRRTIQSFDARIPVTEASVVPALIRASASEERYRTTLMLVFGALGCILAAVGVFSVAARSVALRAREFGVRLALGADCGRLMRRVLGESVGLGGIGLGIGLLAALAVTRTVGAFLFGVATWDPVTYVSVSVVVLVVVAGATLIPIRRVANLAPSDVLRHE
jgi:putative ABC transport system permease protein